MYRKPLLLAILLFLAVVPFFWLKPGHVDLGGDSTRLYFYDPINYLKSYAFYTIAPNGFNTENSATYVIPFTFFLWVLKKIFLSSYLVTTIFNSLTLTLAFLSVFGLVSTMLSFAFGQDKKSYSIYLASFWLRYFIHFLQH